MQGNIHSIETCATVDGPGLRMAIFMQGCPLRCLYCHNPDTWDTKENQLITSDELLKKYDSLKEFFKNGGITLTGGEPLLQIDFITELFKKAKANKIHTALDTSGILFKDNEKFSELIKYVDLVLLDIKHINDDEHKKLTGYSNKPVLDFAKYLDKNHISVWIRHVVVPDITYNEKYLKELKSFIKTLNNVKRIELLPYHDMAKSKYKELGINYALEKTSPLTKEELKNAYDIIML